MSFEVSRKGFRSMDSKSRVPVWVSILAATAAAGLLVVAGCALDKNGAPPESVFNRIGGQNGQIIEPKRCMLKVAILNRPFADPAINEVVWRVADEQVLAPPSGGPGNPMASRRPDYRRVPARARSDPQGHDSRERHHSDQHLSGKRRTVLDPDQ